MASPLERRAVVPPPRLITAELTYRCNLSCPCCYLDKKTGAGEAISPRDISRILAELSGPPPVFHLTGGEPFMRSDLPDIISRIKAAGAYCAVSTNGTLISRRDTSWLRTIGPDHFTISLHGPEKEHEQVNSSPGSCQKTMAGIGYLDALGLLDLVSVNFLQHPANLSSVAEFLDALAGTGVKKISFQHPMFPALPGSGASNEARAARSVFGSMKPEMINQIVEFVRARGKSLAIRTRFIPDLDSAEIARWYSGGYVRTCRYPYFAVRIDPGGNIYPCHNFHKFFGNIRFERLPEIWNSRDFRRFRLGLGKNPRPAGCLNCCKI